MSQDQREPLNSKEGDRSNAKASNCDSVHIAPAAVVLHARRRAILSQYEARLRAVESPLVGEPQRHAQLREQASAILEEAARVLLGRDRVAGPPSDRLSASIGAARAGQKSSAADSLKAALILSEEATSEVAQELGSDWPYEAMAKAAQVIYRCAIERLGRAAVTYTESLLSEVTKSNAAERRRISREMHDRLASPLAVLHHNLELYRCFKDEDPAFAEQKLNRLFPVEGVGQGRAWRAGVGASLPG